MTDTAYDYTIATAFPNAVVDEHKLSVELGVSEIVTALRAVDSDGTTCSVTFKDALSAGDQTLLDGIVAAHDGVPLADSDVSLEGNPVVTLETVQADRTPLVALAGRVSHAFNFATHNFTDKCTWFGESIRKTAQPAVKVGDRWVLPDEYIIDMHHGRVSDERGWCDEQETFNPGDPHRYEFTLYADGVEQEEAAFGTGGDYRVDYQKGLIYPSDGIDWGGKAVTADYSMADTSGWFIRPMDGRVLEIQSSEVQFSNPFEFTAPIIFESYGEVQYFAPQLAQSNGGPYPDTTAIPLDRTVWDTLDQVNDEAKGALPQIPPMGGPDRGITRPRHLLQFIYPGSRRVFSSLGMYVRIWLDGDVPFNGERATATFYGVSLKDPGAGEAIKEFI